MPDRDGSQRTCARPKSGRGQEAIRQRRPRIIAGKTFESATSDRFDQRRAALDDAAADEDSLGLGAEHHVVDQHRQSMLDRGPAWPVVGDWPGAVARTDRGPARQALDAVTMKGAAAGPIVSGKAQDPRVTHLAMAATRNGLSGNDRSHADPGADGNVGQV